MNQYLRTFTLLAAALALGGGVAFENLPDVPTGCDAQLVGQWGEWRNGQSKPGEAVIEIDQQCRIHDLSNRRQTIPAAFRTLTVNGVHYAAFTPVDLGLLFDDASGELDKRFPKDQVFMARYALQGGLLLIDANNPDYVRRVITDKQLKGKKLEKDLYQLQGSPAAITDILK